EPPWDGAAPGTYTARFRPVRRRTRARRKKAYGNRAVQRRTPASTCRLFPESVPSAALIQRKGQGTKRIGWDFEHPSAAARKLQWTYQPRSLRRHRFLRL